GIQGRESEGLGEFRSGSLDSLLMAFLLLLLLLAAHFLHQHKVECLFLNGTQRVRYLNRYFYDGQEFAQFDSDLGGYVAITAFGKVDVDYWNSDEQRLQYQKARVDSLCRYNYKIGSYKAAKREEQVFGRRGESWGGRVSSSLGGGGWDPFPFLASPGDSPPW
uniref:MHC class II beta chain N-terminal domain-containing protein n=1 Tax=Pseudonaja textilis TaxID=8673 RepID=A0A670ZPS0_PSETE